MRTFRTSALILCIALHAGSMAQTMQQWIAWGDASMANGEFYGASRFYAGALFLDPGRMSLQWKQAEACRLSNQYDKAADLYEVVYRKDAGRTYPDALRWLGEMQLCDARYADAEDTWNRILRKEKGEPSVNALRATHAIRGCALAQGPPTPGVEVEHLPEPLNSFASEFAPRIGPDTVLYFSSLRGELERDGEVQDSSTYFTRLYPAQETGGTWSVGAPLVDASMPWNNGNATWTPNGRWIMYTQCDSAGIASIHYAPFNRIDLLGTPLPGLEGGTSTQPMLVQWQGSEWLFFVSDRPGGEGGTDIWRGKIREGRVVDPRPLGPPVNSPGNEASPWFDPDHGQLWFASDFHPGLGGFDIFRSAVEQDAFADPVNAGRPINSPANDLYPSIYPHRNEGWFTSNRKGSFAAKGETCCNDLYRFAWPQDLPAAQDSMVGPLTETTAETEAVVRRLRDRRPLTLYFHNDEPEPRSRSTTTDQTYARTYDGYTALIPTYLARNTDSTGISAFFHDRVQAGRVQLDSLFDELVVALQSGHDVTLHVRGHASPLALNDYNIALSQRRIESLRVHLARSRGGVLAPYLDSTSVDGAVLHIVPLPFGEERSAAGVSDEPTDTDRSIYSVEAARERRIVVERVELPLTDTVQAGPQRFSIGTVARSEPRHFDVPLHNRSDRTLTLISGNAGCECILVDRLPPPIPPGGTGVLRIAYSGRSLAGPLERVITFRTDDPASVFELIITGTVEP